MWRGQPKARKGTPPSRTDTSLTHRTGNTETYTGEGTRKHIRATAPLTRIGHIPGGRRPLLREGGPISYQPRSSASFPQREKGNIHGREHKPWTGHTHRCPTRPQPPQAPQLPSRLPRLLLPTPARHPCSHLEAGSYLRLIDFCITQLTAQGPSRTCNESKEEEESPGKLASLNLQLLRLLQVFLWSPMRSLGFAINVIGGASCARQVRWSTLGMVRAPRRHLSGATPRVPPSPSPGMCTTTPECQHENSVAHSHR